MHWMAHFSGSLYKQVEKEENGKMGRKDGRNETREVRILIPLVLTESNDRPINKMSTQTMKRDILRSDIIGMFTQEKGQQHFQIPGPLGRNKETKRRIGNALNRTKMKVIPGVSVFFFCTKVRVFH